MFGNSTGPQLTDADIGRRLKFIVTIPKRRRETDTQTQDRLLALLEATRDAETVAAKRGPHSVTVTFYNPATNDFDKVVP